MGEDVAVQEEQSTFLYEAAGFLLGGASGSLVNGFLGDERQPQLQEPASVAAVEINESQTSNVVQAAAPVGVASLFDFISLEEESEIQPDSTTPSVQKAKDDDTISLVLSDREVLLDNREEQPPPWVRTRLRRGSIHSPLLRLHQEIADFSALVAPTEEEQSERVAAVQRVSTVAKALWKSCQVKVFGSFATGLYLPTSDIDMVVLDSGCAVPATGLHALAKALLKTGVAKKLQVIAKAKVPIVKFTEVESDIAFDISLDVTNGDNAARFIQAAMKAVPPLKPLCMVLKTYLQQRELNEVYSGGIGSYALLVMLLAHLQLHPSRRNGSSGAARGEPMEANLGILLVDFFELYGKSLNVYEVGVSCQDGGAFYSKHARRLVDFGRPFMLSVEDPQAADNDLARNSFNVSKVRAAFMHAHRLLTSPSPEDELDSKGILGRILRMDDILAHRAIPPALPPLPPIKPTPSPGGGRWRGGGRQAPDDEECFPRGSGHASRDAAPVHQDSHGHGRSKKRARDGPDEPHGRGSHGHGKHKHFLEDEAGHGQQQEQQHRHHHHHHHHRHHHTSSSGGGGGGGGGKHSKGSSRNFSPPFKASKQNVHELYHGNAAAGQADRGHHQHHHRHQHHGRDRDAGEGWAREGHREPRYDESEKRSSKKKSKHRH